jgi:hypothetical protein
MILSLRVLGAYCRLYSMSGPKRASGRQILAISLQDMCFSFQFYYGGPLFLEGRNEIVRQFRILLKPLALVRSSQPRAGSRSGFTTSC